MVPPNSQAACWYLMFRDLLFRDCMIHSAQVLESVRDRGCHVFTASLLKLEHSSFQSPIKLYNPWFLSSLQEEGDKSWLIVAFSWLPITPILLLIPLTNILEHQFCAGPLLDTENSAVKKQTKPLSGKAVRV